MARKSVLICRVAMPNREQARAVTQKAIASGRADVRDVAAVEASLNTHGHRLALFDAGSLMRLQRAAAGQ
ncbi:hypothetical protein [Paraburkholderia aromaticivorans]|uniref:hypothetical protein n=1 Tax=Paraburkholderia aromaticivorans TaxID=2026199 RepID=UPI0014560246|nr:hypothetical protein [Paraburkholderia aromaticivorans]